MVAARSSLPLAASIYTGQAGQGRQLPAQMLLLPPLFRSQGPWPWGHRGDTALGMAPVRDARARAPPGVGVALLVRGHSPVPAREVGVSLLYLNKFLQGSSGLPPSRILLMWGSRVPWAASDPSGVCGQGELSTTTLQGPHLSPKVAVPRHHVLGWFDVPSSHHRSPTPGNAIDPKGDRPCSCHHEGVPTVTAVAAWHRAQCHLAPLLVQSSLSVPSPKPGHGTMTLGFLLCRSHSGGAVTQLFSGKVANNSPRVGAGGAPEPGMGGGKGQWWGAGGDGSEQAGASPWLDTVDGHGVEGQGEGPTATGGCWEWALHGRRGVPPPKKKHGEECPYIES